MTEKEVNVFFSTDKDECQKRIDDLIETLKNTSFQHSKGLITTVEMNVKVVDIIIRELYEISGLSKELEEGKELTINPDPERVPQVK